MGSNFFRLGVGIAVFYWFVDSSIHYFVYSEPSFGLIPHDMYELWVRLLIVALMVLFGWYTEHSKRTSQRILERSERLYGGLVNASPDLIWQLSLQGVVTYISPSVKAISGFEPEEVLGKPIAEFLTDESAQRAARMVQERIQGENGDKSIAYELSHYRKDGSIFPCEVHSLPIFGADGELAAIQGISRDISERKQWVNMLQESEAKYRTFFEKSADAMLMIRDYMFVDCNAATVAMLKHESKEDLLNTHPSVLSPEFQPDGKRSYDKAMEMMEIALAKGTHRFEWDHKRKDGEVFPVEVSLTAIPQEEGTVLHTVWHDITARKQMEEELRKNEERYRELVEGTNDLVTRTDETGCFTYVNGIADRAFGISVDECIGRSAFDFVHPDDRDKTEQWFQDCIAKQTARASFENRQVNLKTGELSQVLWTARFKYNQKGQPLSVDSFGRDVTDRKRMEEELVKVEKLESIGVLAGGIAHDLNNFLMGIVGNIGLARKSGDPEHRDERLANAEKSAMQVKDLTQQLLTFSKGGSPVRGRTDLGALVRDTVDFTLSGSNIQCDYSLLDDTYLVEIDAGQIRQVINNLIINAQQAMPGGGTIKVAAQHIDLDDNDVISLAAGSYIEITFEDEGVGMPEHVRKHIFDPFFTTKSVGSGLGLATCYSIMQKHGGSIRVESEVGVGTKFDIYLLASQLELTDQSDEEEPVPLIGEGRVLLMDDQQSIIDMVSTLLRNSGYEVETSVDGIEAIEKYTEAIASGNPFHAVILDLTIPGGMGGAETMTQLKEIDPSVRAIVASGYSSDSVMTDYQKYGFKGAISKPYRVDDLRRLLHEVFNEG